MSSLPSSLLRSEPFHAFLPIFGGTLTRLSFQDCLSGDIEPVGETLPEFLVLVSAFVVVGFNKRTNITISGRAWANEVKPTLFGVLIVLKVRRLPFFSPVRLLISK